MKYKSKNHLRHKNIRAKRVKKYTDKIFAQEKEIFDLKQLLEISKSLNSVLELDRVIEAISYTVMAQLKASGAAIFTKTISDDNFVLNKNHYGFDILKDNTHSISASHPILALLENAQAGISIEDIKNKLENDKTITMLLKLNPSYLVPLIVKNRMIGFLMLGERFITKYEYTCYEKKL